MTIYPPAILEAVAYLGNPYGFGSKWEIGSLPTFGDPIDCSGFSRYVLNKAGFTLPDGSYDQIKVCTKLPASSQNDPPALCLGFYQSPDSVQVDHVVISCGHGVVIEARGKPYDSVILRPVSAWINQPGFLGFYSPPGYSASY